MRFETVADRWSRVCGEWRDLRVLPEALAYTLEVLLLFGAAGRWVPLDRLTPYGDEEGLTRHVQGSARTNIWRLRQRGYEIERHPNWMPPRYRLVIR